MLLGDLMSTDKSTIKEALIKLKDRFAQEGQDTKEMLEIYGKSLTGAATDDELAQANLQLQDLLKGMGLGILLVLPFAPITLPLAVQLGKKFGIDILPSSTKDKKKGDQS